MNYLAPVTDIGQFDLQMNATYLDNYTETTNNVDGSKTVNDLTGTITDVRVSYAFNPDGGGFTIALGARNVFDKDPAVCLNTCGSINMSPVLHDLPGTFGYLQVSYRH